VEEEREEISELIILSAKSGTRQDGDWDIERLSRKEVLTETEWYMEQRSPR
jgi:hypothetical protein